ncbi:MAG: arsenate reductase ArsC [Lysobacter sp.]
MIQRVLFLCTGNSARSVLAEATLSAWGEGRFEAFSAGSRPTGRVNPFALEQLAAEGIPTSGLRSKLWDEFSGDGAPLIDVVVTVCDGAAAETCPVFFGDFVRTHWGLPDPAAVDGSDDDKRAAFAQAHAVIKQRLTALLTLAAETWSDREALRLALDRIGLIGSQDGDHG